MDYTGVGPERYSLVDDAFITKLKAVKKNTLVVAHSNTIDDMINRIISESNIPGDLPDAGYDNLYIVKKSGGRLSFKATTLMFPLIKMVLNC